MDQVSRIPINIVTVSLTVSALYIIQQTPAVAEVCCGRSEGNAGVAPRTEYHLLHRGHRKGGAAFGAYHGLGAGDLLDRRLHRQLIELGAHPGRQRMRGRRFRVPGPLVRRSFRCRHRRAHSWRRGQQRFAERAGTQIGLQNAAAVWTAYVPAIRWFEQCEFLLSGWR